VINRRDSRLDHRRCCVPVRVADEDDKNKNALMNSALVSPMS
jgi:hypothetical protein